MSKPSKADLLIYKALNKAIEKDQLRIYLDYGKINRPGSPVYDAWENLLPVLTPVLTGLILILSVSVIFGLSFMIAMIMIYTAYFKRKLTAALFSEPKTILPAAMTTASSFGNSAVSFWSMRRIKIRLCFARR